MLNTQAAETAVLALLDDQAARTDSSPAARQQARADFARELVGIMATMMRSGTVTGTVTTLGSATTQTGPLTNGRIS
ncbi:hypothetical protein [Hymenobacter negativus]|uniref:Uncharacterized protein n=1 Tax=Hymenobacter negativus TaxID=2795026 RepID=A0ABS3QD54_9BACT|nr:hypothetical protein [Hymenobacter negativus]MBO2009164.1 hypothetical protein [Hymenobacter negativus]